MSDMQYKVTWSDTIGTRNAITTFDSIEEVGEALTTKIFVHKIEEQLITTSFISTEDLIEKAKLALRYQNQVVRVEAIRAKLVAAKREVSKLRTHLSIESRRKVI